MTRLLAALLLATAALPCGGGAQVSPFSPDTLLQPPGGPRIVILGTPGEGVAALRLAVPLHEGPAEAGAGHILRELALRRMETDGKSWDVAIRDMAAGIHSYYTTPLGVVMRQDLFGPDAIFFTPDAYDWTIRIGAQPDAKQA